MRLPTPLKGQLSVLFVIFLLSPFPIDKLLFGEPPVLVVDDQHSLILEGNAALVADVGTSQRVVSRYHHHPDLSLLQLPYGASCLSLELVFEHLETVENKRGLGLLAID